MAKKINTEYIADLNKLYEDFLSSDYIDDLESFKEFLKENGFSTQHAQEIYSYCKDPDNNQLILDKNSLKFRKTHPKRDYFIKKVLIPTAITTAGIGAAAGAILSSGLIGGSTVMGIIPVSGTPGLTMMATSMVGALAGLASTPIVLKAKKAITKAHYKAWYKSAKRNLKEYETGVDMDSLYITKLINKVQETKKSILKTNHGSWVTAPFRFAKRHFLNTINRNRIHHIEAYTEDLVKMFHSLELNNVENKEEKLKPIYELLKQVDNFVSDDVNESKIYAMLTCKESGKHIHRSMIENVDIFSTLKIFIDGVSKASLNETNKNSSKLKKNAKNLANKKAKAAEIVNGDRLIARLVAKYEADEQAKIDAEARRQDEARRRAEAERLARERAEAEERARREAEERARREAEERARREAEERARREAEEKARREAEEKKLEEARRKAEAERLAREKAEAEEKARREAEEKRQQNLLARAALRAQSVNYKSKPIMFNNEMIGTMLQIKTSDNTEKVEIRYMASKKQIRVKTTNSKNPEISTEKLIPITDTEIPPYTQMGEILKDVAKSKHISNVEDLVIDV